MITCDHDLMVYFRWFMQLDSDLPCLSVCLLDVFMFKRNQSIEITHQDQCDSYRWLFDSFNGEKGKESEIQLEIHNESEKLKNQMYLYFAGSFGYVILSNSILRKTIISLVWSRWKHSVLCTKWTSECSRNRCNSGGTQRVETIGITSIQQRP